MLVIRSIILSNGYADIQQGVRFKLAILVLSCIHTNYK
jgi:hypothetical protein